MEQTGKGTVWFVITFSHEVTREYTEHCREIISQMFEEEIFSMKRGKAILSFDIEGKLGSIEKRIMSWRKNKPLLQKSVNFVKVNTYNSIPAFTSYLERANP